MQKWSPYQAKHSQHEVSADHIQEFKPKSLDFTKKPTDAFMTQFSNIAQGPLDGQGFTSGVNISSMTDITNQGEMFVLQQAALSS